MDKCRGQAVLQSTSDPDSFSKKILIIDTMGKLSKIYKYADVAYVGGGFGTGLHNVLEPAVWGKPIIIGPEYQKFKEAKGLVDLKAAIPVVEKTDFPKIIRKLSDPEKREKLGQIAKEYVQSNAGATQIILSEIGKILD
jgi:3-deoxy-D-manno-octulosonic-acid transferase